MPLEEAVLSASLQVVFEKLASPILKEFGFQWGIDKELRKLGGTLSKIQAVISDAEERQISNRAVKVWLDDLKDLAFDADDILDEFATEALRLRLEAENQDNSSQVRSLVPSNMSSFKLSVTSRIHDISERLDDAAKERVYLGLKEGLGPSEFKVEVRPETSSLVDTKSILGRENDKEKIVRWLLSDEPTKKNFSVISIVGMGGLGKTTLAQLVYNDERVAAYFDIKAWNCVSTDLDFKRCTRAVLESATRKEHKLDNLDPLQVNLKEILNQKRFLIVLDDVWSMDGNSWGQLQAPFHGAARGSIILITTRNNKVASVRQAIYVHHLNTLSNEDCWSLFAQYAFPKQKSIAYPNLVSIGKKIVESCGGLPSIIKTVGSPLESDVDEEAWDDICTNTIWELEELTNEVLLGLKLSYRCLPAHLKRCFSYCSIFPPKYLFQKEKLVLLWIAEGFVQPNGKKQLEDIGNQYFEDLVNQSFFKRSPHNEQNFVMHEVVHGLARSVSREICFRWEDVDFDVSDRARHSSFFLGLSKPTNFQSLYKAKKLRTFLLQRAFMFLALPKDLDLHAMLQELRCLRVLCFNQVSFSDLPESIGNLKHLRLLDLSQTWITRLPASINNLYNLQTLVLNECPNFQEMPPDIGNLINLRHLFLSTDCELEKMPKGIGKLTCLQTLPIFVVGKRSSPGIRELGNLLHLRGSPRISKLNHVRDALDAKEVNLEKKQHLQELDLQWDDEANVDDKVQEDVLEYLQPHKRLKKLTIRSYGGRMFPTWMRQSSLRNLIDCSLHSCIKCKFLPPLGGLPLLKHLTVKRMQSIKLVGQEFAKGGFPALETLKFEDMPEWEKWSNTEGEFVHLRSLNIKRCPKLRAFSNRFPNLITLHIEMCKQMIALPRFQMQGEEFPCLRELKVENCTKLKELPQLLPALVKMELHECEELTTLPIVPSLNCLHLQGLHAIQKPFSHLERHLDCLRELTIWNCNKLLQLPSMLPSLVNLDIRNCKQLTAIPGPFLLQTAEVEGKGYPSLSELIIKNCPKLQGLTGNFPSLLKLEIRMCNLLAALPRLPSLCNLEIDECDDMLQVPFPYLKSVSYLCMSKISKLICIPEGLLKSLEALRELKIDNCNELMSLWLDDGQNTFTSLQRIEIWCCNRLASLPNRVPVTLETLKLIYCCNLESLPDCIHLTNLKDLEISNTDKLVSFPKEGLPLTLSRLVIKKCRSLKDLPSGLHKLICLQILEIRNCPATESIPDEGFPVSVKWISIFGCENLKCLPSEMRTLTSLLELRISNVPKLATLPEDGFPATLHYLDIENCPLITVRCKSSDAEVWPKIAHILVKRIDGKEV